ncbi:MAG: UDP-N-acetylglucosamine 2-epimerase (non-hydrolyzing) [Pseudomonadota bacterium]
MSQILTVIGARPQFIKAAAVSRCIEEASGLTEILVHTGQHYDANMSDIFFDELGIPMPAHHLGIAGGGHGAMTGRMLAAVEDLLVAVQPDLVMVYGDTNSTLAGALAAAKLHIPVAHVEAGLRSFNKRMPEEINRILTDHCAELLFTPTQTATKNLLDEGMPQERIVECGDVMFDASLHFARRAEEQAAGAKDKGLERGEYVLATVHRQENTDDPARLNAIIEGLAMVAKDMPVVLPLHPRTRARLEAECLSDTLGDLQIIEPLGYLEMVGLEKDAAVIATDSGGVQKEAFFHGVPCVTLRDETEWVELVDAGWNQLLSPTSPDLVYAAIAGAKGTQGNAIAPYGAGNASEVIVDRLKAFL